MFLTTISVGLAFVALSQGSSGPPVAGLLARKGTDACKEVSDVAAKWYKDNNVVPRVFDMEDLDESILSTMVPTAPPAPVKPSLAFSCLKSVPLNKTVALAHIQWLRPAFEWQSTLDYLKDPPRGYLSEAADLVGGLDEIAEKLNKSVYANEFEWLSDLHALGAYRARDGHFNFLPTMLDLFTFSLGAKFVSVSKDGVSPPHVFLRGDVKSTTEGYTPSPITSVDGIPIAEYLGKRSLHTVQSQDPDARYNSLFESVAKDIAAVYGLQQPELLTGLKDTSTVNFENGTTLELQNVALLRANFTTVTSGADVYRQWGVRDGSGSPVLPWVFHVPALRNFTTDFSAYPLAIGRADDGSTGGYVPANRDFAVISVTTFDTGNQLNLTNIRSNTAIKRDIIVDTIRTAKAQGRKRLIIDLQPNGGGLAVNLLMLYALLFPESPSLPLLWQHRAHDQLKWLVEESKSGSPFSERQFLQPNGEAWPNATARYGPVPAPAPGGEKWGFYTRPSLWNNTERLQNTVWGYTHVHPWDTNPYKPEDIIVLLDGECGSSCAIFTSSLVHGHGVKTVAVGGRPIEAPMQGIGQVKGGAILLLPMFGLDYDGMLEHLTSKFLHEEEPPVKTSAVIVNEANMYPVGKSQIPMQFAYEAANCKLFYKWDDLASIQGLWDRVADVTWGKGKCVKGSTTEKDDRMGGVPGYRKEVEDRFKLDAKWPGRVGK
ncbi:hypothetical protein OQA88_11595 [Cercophora sp. LCS_1]